MQRDASSSPAWQRLKALAAAPLPSIADLIAAEGDRVGRCTVTGAGLTLDFTRQRLGPDVLPVLAQLAENVDLRARIAAMYRGDIANPTEGRQVLHTALRRNGAPHADVVQAERKRMLGFAGSPAGCCRDRRRGYRCTSAPRYCG